MGTVDLRSRFAQVEWIARGQVAIARDFDSASLLVQALEAEGHVIISAARAGAYNWVFRLVDRDQRTLELYVILDLEVLQYEVAYWNDQASNWARYHQGDRYSWPTHEEAHRVATKLRRHFSGKVEVRPSLFRP